MAGPLALERERGASPLATPSRALQDILPWFVHDALIHYLAPRGLEQYSGGGWGTRDVCQGPVELLLALGRWEPMRDLLLRVFANQNPDGDWPQWFMFFERERGIRPGDSHGDIVFWPLLRAGAVPARHRGRVDPRRGRAVLPSGGPRCTPSAPRSGSTSSARWRSSQQRVIPGTHLAAYGHGDWNDSLQPADPAMRERLCSTWTVTLHHQTLTTLAAALRRLGRDADAAAPRERRAPRVRADFARWLIVDGELAGFAYFHRDGRVDYLLHPRDRAHRHPLQPAADDPRHHQRPAHAGAGGGARRAHPDAPARRRRRAPVRPAAAYRGGPQRHFQRAESSTFFGREIGLMYTHAHLRYAEAHGALRRRRRLLRSAAPRQSRSASAPSCRRRAPRQANCYYSSSDAAFADRYEAAGATPTSWPAACRSRAAGASTRAAPASRCV